MVSHLVQNLITGATLRSPCLPFPSIASQGSSAEHLGCCKTATQVSTTIFLLDFHYSWDRTHMDYPMTYFFSSDKSPQEYPRFQTLINQPKFASSHTHGSIGILTKKLFSSKLLASIMHLLLSSCLFFILFLLEQRRRDCL